MRPAAQANYSYYSYFFQFKLIIPISVYSLRFHSTALYGKLLDHELVTLHEVDTGRQQLRQGGTGDFAAHEATAEVMDID